MGGNVVSRVEMNSTDRVSSILKVINANRSNLDRAVEELSSYQGAPRSKEDIEQYGKKLIEDLTNRLEKGETKYFPGVSDKEIREKIFPPLREYVENTPEKLIVREHGDKPLKIGIFYPDKQLYKGEINIHPILIHLYGLGGATSAVVYYGPTSVSFSPIRHHTYYTHSGIYLGFHDSDIGSLFMDSMLELLEKNVTRRDFRVGLDSSGKTAVIQVEKIKSAIKPSGDKEIDFTPVTENLIKTLTDSYKENIGKKDEEIRGLKETLSKVFLATRSADILEEEISKVLPTKVKPSVAEESLKTVRLPELPLEVPEILIDVRDSAQKLHGLSGSMFEPYKLLLQERENLINLLVDAKLHRESFFKDITEKWYLSVGNILETEHLGNKEYDVPRLFIQSVVSDIINYVNKHEDDINKLRQKLAKIKTE